MLKKKKETKKEKVLVKKSKVKAKPKRLVLKDLMVPGFTNRDIRKAYALLRYIIYKAVITDTEVPLPCGTFRIKNGKGRITHLGGNNEPVKRYKMAPNIVLRRGKEADIRKAISTATDYLEKYTTAPGASGRPKKEKKQLSLSDLKKMIKKLKKLEEMLEDIAVQAIKPNKEKNKGDKVMSEKEKKKTKAEELEKELNVDLSDDEDYDDEDYDDEENEEEGDDEDDFDEDED